VNPVLKVELSIEHLREMEQAGGGGLILEVQNEETGETTEVRIEIPLKLIKQMIAIQEGAERAMRN
jgi:hypothetical protein